MRIGTRNVVSIIFHISLVSSRDSIKYFANVKRDKICAKERIYSNLTNNRIQRKMDGERRSIPRLFLPLMLEYANNKASIENEIICFEY